MENQILVSVIIPCYNQGEFLEDCLTSVYASSYREIEVIVVNDGSIDNTDLIIRELQNTFSFHLIEQENQGLAQTRNIGILSSKGKYILPLDADDKIGVTYIENAVKKIESQKNIGIVYSKALLFGEKQGEWKLPTFSFEQILTQNLIFNCALFRREDYNKTSGYNINMKEGWEDWDFWLSLIELGLDVECLDEIGFYYRIRTNSMVRNLSKEKNRGLRKQIYFNHLDLYLKHFDNPINQYFEIQDLNEFKKSFYHLLNSKDYKIGKFVLSPIRIIKKIIQKKA